MNRTEHLFVFRDGRILARRDRVVIRPFSGEQWPMLQPWAETVLPLGKAGDGRSCAVEMAAAFETGADLEWLPLRSLVGLVDEAGFNEWARAAQLLNWWNTHRYCGRCGQQTVTEGTEAARVCPACAHTSYPRISPCVIVLVHREEELLLARSPRFTTGMYSTLAGFVEAGESVEETVRREIFEEVAIRVKNIRYFASQPWPFPDQLMLGFFAEYESGEITIDEVEISDAGWYHYRTLPMIPGEGTIAGRMIRHWLASLNGCQSAG